jgi:hypothetical protein
MAITLDSTQGVTKPIELKKKQAGIILMLTRGHFADGKVSHELIKEII